MCKNQEKNIGEIQKKTFYSDSTCKNKVESTYTNNPNEAC